MKKKSILKASFEESLNLEDDGFVKLQEEQHEKFSKKIINGSTTFGFKMQAFILTLLFPVLVNYLIVLMSGIVSNFQSWELSIEAAENNFLDIRVYVIGLALWFLLVLTGRYFKQAFIIPYRYHFHLFTYMVILYLEFDLLILGIALANVPFWLFLIVVFLWLVSIIFMIRVELRGMRKILFDEDSQPGKLDKLAKIISLYGMGLLGIGIVVSRFIGMIAGTNKGALEEIGMIILIIVLNFLMPGIVIFIGIPYFTRAYYKLKYPEQYRDYEGKSFEEWYGKKYLKKHKELTAHD